MRLQLLMYGFYILFKLTAWKTNEFKEKLMEKDVILVMKAKDKNIVRTYIFNAGKVTSTSDELQEANCKLIWSTAKDGAAVMTSIAKGDPKALMNAVVEGKLILEGDALAITWYMASVSMLGKMYIKKKKKNKKPGNAEIIN